jgi:hypothetical protein
MDALYVATGVINGSDLCHASTGAGAAAIIRLMRPYKKPSLSFTLTPSTWAAMVLSCFDP